MNPTATKERHIVLDALRGFALLGICMANFPEFSLYNFLPSEAASEMPWASADGVTRFLLNLFVDGKFYTIFSLLFGIGFSIIIENAAKKGANGFRIFYRRMLILVAIGFCHLMFLWSGDILMLYALMGMILPLFRRASNRVLLTTAGVLLAVPIVVDGLCEVMGVSLSKGLVDWQWALCAEYGITEENFAYWLRDAESYGAMFQFLIQGAVVRLQEFVDGNRYFKVLGLFLIGFYVGRNKIYADLEGNKRFLKKVAVVCGAIGLPLSVVYAYSGCVGHPWGGAVHTILYTVSVYPLAFCYVAAIALLCNKFRGATIWKCLAAPGRMALTNYIGQSVIGIILFYGIGFGLGARFGLLQTELIVLCVYLFEMGASYLWLRVFAFGPLEWVWRMLTYGKFLQLRKTA